MLNKRLEAIAVYLKQVGKSLARGDSTEHTHRPALQQLIQQIHKGIVCVNEPKGSSAAGHPDMKVLLGETPLGFIEAKDVGLDLVEIAETPQLKRYLKHIPNLILTDYLEFRWYQNGNLADTVRLATVLASGKLRRYDKGGESLLTLLDNFLTADVKTVGSPKELAERMATLAKWVRRVIVESFEAESAGQELHSQLKAFREVLLPDLDVPKFADMYAQTICYGLFAGKCNADPGIAFARDNAASYLPRTNPFLRKLFSSIMAGDLNEKVAGAIDAITFLLDHADVGAILKDFNKRTRREDPVVHFYETFLAAYDPRLRKTRGVYYTPEPVVSYIVRSVDWLLKEKFGKKDGLADPSVLVLDPACGTGTFLYHVIKLIHERVKAKGQYGSWSSYVRDSLLPRVFGFELLMAPYAVAHLKLGLLLQDTGYDFGSDERLGIFLTNTLEEAAKKSDVLFAQYISDEANAATDIKRDKPIMVVLGNPPYAGYSANTGSWIEAQMETYKTTVRSEERQIQRLSNDYVKFIRFAQWRLDLTGSGVLGFITDSGYLQGLLFRDMRRSLMTSFPSVSILDLYGVAMRGAAKLSGSDQNVFDITQGVAIGIFVKSSTGPSAPSVRHAELCGSRESKYKYLSSEDMASTEWSAIAPRAPDYGFTPSARDDTYLAYASFLDIIGTGNPKADRDDRYGTGIKTRHDQFVVGWTPAHAVDLVRQIANRPETDAQLIAELGLCTTAHFSIGQARTRAAASDLLDYVRPIQYRPFDTRFVVYLREFVCEPKAETTRHMTAVASNVAMGVLRRDRREQSAGFFVGRGLIAKDFVSNLDDAVVWPLYAVPSSRARGTLFGAGSEGGVSPNLSPKFVAEMEQKLGLKFVAEQPEAVSRKPSADSPFGPEDVFDYIYAVFHSPTYRKRYAEFLKIDFPRVPLTTDKKLFWKLVALGHELVALHLLESPKVNDFVTKYPKKGSDTVVKVDYDDNKARVLINGEQYFEGVRPEWFEFHIGGYQVLHKWLKDRKGRKLSNDDIKHYQRVVVAIKETIRLMSEIDKAIPSWPIE